MPRLVHSTPKYRKHKASGQAVVTIAGVDYYLGPYGTKASRIEYDRLIMEWLAAGRPSFATAQPHAAQARIADLILEYWRFAKRHYRKHGKPTAELHCIKSALRPLRELYGDTPAAEFGPKRLKAVRKAMIDAGISRGTINRYVSRIRRLFRWAVAEELVPVSVYQALSTVSGLQRGRTEARETAPVEPVATPVVEATLPHLPPIVADMVRLQLFTGCRPAEVCMIRPCDVDASGDVWIYQPQSHKTEHHGRLRKIFIGPRGQEVLRPYLLRDKQSYCFVPAEGERKRRARLREARKSPMTPSQAARKRKSRPKRSAGNRYTTASYRRAITRACEVAFGMPDELRIIPRNLPDEERGALRTRAAAWRAEHCWAPNQLRHTAATTVRAAFGLEAAQTVLGHSSVDTTQLYAERDFSLAREVAAKIG